MLATGLALTLGLGGITPAGATFPGPNGRILFFGKVKGQYQVFSIRADGTGRRQLTDLRHGADVATATADGSMIAFGSRANVWIMRADGSGTRRLTSRHTDFSPAISPEGRHIAFGRITPRLVELVVMNADGTHAKAIVRRKGFQAYVPDWSPDGTRLAFTMSRFIDNAHPRVFTVRPNGNDLTRVPIAFSHNTIQDAAGASWSPDGSRFVFFAQPVHDGKPTCDSQNGFQCNDVYVVGVDGGAPTRLTNDREDDFYPIWSPDGSEITVSHDATRGGCKLFEEDCRYDVTVLNADGSHARQLTHTPNRDEEPTWWMVG
jgi:TolB protein